MADEPQKKLSSRDSMIINILTLVGIAGGIAARHLLGMQGIFFGALFGAGGAIVGVLIGYTIIAVLPPAQPKA